MLPEVKEIKERRLRLRISQRELAKNLGVSQSIVAKIERNKVSPSYLLVKKVFTYLESVHATEGGRAAEIASRPVAYVQFDDAVQKGVHILQSTGYKQLPVRYEDVWAGCLYQRTISRHLLETGDPRSVLRRQVGQIMDEALPSVAEETPTTAIIPLLQQYQAVLVTRKGRVTGIITNTDLLKLIS
ncbi:MAG: helix-turn-helix domain-containing protein [Thaumarchaeota archaeon]|nr:helix-turn-helix domain-containing protein [Nitrososphaerota archaeon]